MLSDTDRNTEKAFRSLLQQHLWAIAFDCLVDEHTASIWESPEYKKLTLEIQNALSVIPRAQAGVIDELVMQAVCQIAESAFLRGIFAGIQGASPSGLFPPNVAAKHDENA